VTNNMTWLVDV